MHILKAAIKKMCTNISSTPNDKVREFLHKFVGGTVILNKNESSGVATIALDHPEKRNAMSGRMMVELNDRIDELEQWTTGKALILLGKGGNLCSGGDLDFARATGNCDGALNMSAWMLHTLNRIRTLPLFSVCIVEGATLGGGAELSVYCDFILAADNAKYGFVHGKLGIIPAWGGATRLANKVGPSKALDLMLTAKILNAQELVDIGLAETVISSLNPLDEAETWIKARLVHHHTITRAMKKVVTNANSELECSRWLEQKIFLPLWGGDLNKAALEKRVKHVKDE